MNIRCIKDGVCNITKGKLYTIKTKQNNISTESYLKTNIGVYITDDIGNSCDYLSTYFIDIDDKQTWRNIKLEELIF